MSQQHISGAENYFQNHIWYTKRSIHDEQNIHKQFNLEIFEQLPKNKNSIILDIGYGQWYFATYINKLWYTDYTGVDIDNRYQEDLQELLPNYTFEHKNIFDFFKKNTDLQYDVIFSSNIFEHLWEQDRIVWIKNIHKHLRNWWIWINYMPNADSILWSTSARYTDITHYTIYNIISFSQLLNQYSKFSSIQHINQYIWTSTIKRFIHKIIRSLYKIIYASLWFTFPTIYTGQIITLCKK